LGDESEGKKRVGVRDERKQKKNKKRTKEKNKKGRLQGG